MRKDLWKNPDTYFIVLPILAGLWALTAAAVLYPRSVRAWNEQKDEYVEAETLIAQILELEPERLQFQEESSRPSEFDYVTEVDRFAKQFGIPSSNYTLTVRQALQQRGKMRKSADLSINSIRVETLAGFLSSMLFRWTDLQCEQVSLEKIGNEKNQWKVKVRFIYYY